MAIPLNKRKLVLNGMNRSPGKPFLDVYRYAVPPSAMVPLSPAGESAMVPLSPPGESAMVPLSPPGERDAPLPYPIKTYYTHPHSDILIGTRTKYTDEADEYREIPEFPHAIFEVYRTLVPNKFYTINNPTNGAFSYTLDELRAVEQKRLQTINASRARARGGKSRRSRRPKKHHKRTIRRRV